MESYISFAEFYDGLTENVNYKDRCKYILDIFRNLNHNTGKTLDLACGTGSLTLELAKNNVDVFGVDASEDMLCQAQFKAAQAEKNILFLCQEMQSLDLYGEIDTCICTLDSINHLTSEKDVLNTFKSVSKFLRKSGYFLFDVNTPYKHREILADNTFVYDTDEVFCIWQNTLLENDTVEIFLDFFEEDQTGKYIRTSESFFERAYSHMEIINMLNEAGFELVDYYGDMTFEKPKEDEQRVIYVARKI